MDRKKENVVGGDIEPHIDDIVRTLGGRISRDEIADELENYLRVYRVSMDDAKRSIVKKFGGTPVVFSVGVKKKLVELTGRENNVNLLCRVVSINAKEIEQEGTRKGILYGIFEDDTTTVPFTIWEIKGVDLKKGDVIRVENAYTKEWNGRVQIHLGVRARITQEDRDAVPMPKRTLSKVEELEDGMRNVSLVARILSIEKREVEVDGKKKTVFSGSLGDGTGKIRFSAWADFKLKEDEVVQIEGAYVKSWRSMLQMNFDDSSRVERSADKLPSKKEILSSKTCLGDLGGGVDLSVQGIIVDVKAGSGLIYRCPECGRAVKKGSCTIHGQVKATPDLRIKAILDDGTGTLNVVVGKAATEKLLKKDLKACLEETRESPNPEIIKDELFQLLIAQPMALRGNVIEDDFGLTMIAESVEFLETNVKEEATGLLEELEM